jgi:hypothetical protein
MQVHLQQGFGDQAVQQQAEFSPLSTREVSRSGSDSTLGRRQLKQRMPVRK